MRQKLGRPSFFAALILVIAIIAAWWLFAPPAPGPLRLTPVGFSDLPGWKDSDARAALAAFQRSCAAMQRKSAAASMGGAGYAGTIGDWRDVCADAQNASNARAFFERDFTPVEVSAGRVRDGLFTGYYEPQLRGSRKKHGAYRTPVYGLPDDLVSVDLGLFLPEMKGEHISGRLDKNALVPYATRAQIDTKGASHAPVLFYCDDPVAVFFMHIQGSGRVVLDDDSIIRVAYAGQNGHPYTPIGRTLIHQGVLTRDDVSMQSIRDWLKKNPKEARGVMESDASFIFFREMPIGNPKLGSPGSEGVALTPAASLAVDLRLHPLGAAFFVASKTGNHLLVAQDTGGAIRGPVRGDIFWGFGQKAEDIAGHMTSRGRLFVLLPKPVAARLGARKDFPS